MIRVTWHRPLVSRGWIVESLTPTWHYQACPHGVSQCKRIAVYMLIPTLTWGILADSEHSSARRCTASRASHGRLACEKVRYGYRVRSRSSRAPPSSDQSSRQSHHRKDLRAHRSWHLRRKERCRLAPYAMQPASIRSRVSTSNTKSCTSLVSQRCGAPSRCPDHGLGHHPRIV